MDLMPSLLDIMQESRKNEQIIKNSSDESIQKKTRVTSSQHSLESNLNKLSFLLDISQNLKYEKLLEERDFLMLKEKILKGSVLLER